MNFVSNDTCNCICKYVHIVVNFIFSNGHFGECDISRGEVDVCFCLCVIALS